jgi:phage terminase large subunit-like protein
MPEESISVKYNENNPEDYYEEGATLDKSGMIWYIVKIVALILLIILFFNKKLLSKIGISASANRN